MTNCRTKNPFPWAKSSDGQVVFSGIFPISNAITPYHVETLAILSGLQFADTFNLKRVDIETNCLRAMQEIGSALMGKFREKWSLTERSSSFKFHEY